MARAGVINAMAEAMWQQESIRATGRKRNVPWADAGPQTREVWLNTARAAHEAGKEAMAKEVELLRGAAVKAASVLCGEAMSKQSLIEALEALNNALKGDGSAYTCDLCAKSPTVVGHDQDGDYMLCSRHSAERRRAG